MFVTATEIFYRAYAALESAPAFAIPLLLGILALIALLIGARLLHLWHVGVHREYAGPGRVIFLALFRGAGYCVVLRRGRGRDGKPLGAPGWRPNIVIPGFTIYLRTTRSSRSPYPGRGTPVKRFRITKNPNLPVA